MPIAKRAKKTLALAGELSGLALRWIDLRANETEAAQSGKA